MAMTMTTIEAIENIDEMVERGQNRKQIFEFLTDTGGFTEQQVLDLFVQTGLHTVREEKYKNTQKQSEDNFLEAGLGSLLSIGITYVIPMLLIGFGVLYVWNEMATDMNVGIRSAAAALMPMAITLAFAKSNIRNNAVDFLSDNKMISFAFSFALAMVAAGLAMYMRQFDNVIPIGELAISTTLALMIFGNKNNGEVPFLHVGAVSGLLTYVILFGIPL